MRAGRRQGHSPCLSRESCMLWVDMQKVYGAWVLKPPPEV